MHRTGNLPPALTTAPAELLTVIEVASALRVDPATVRRWIANGIIPATRIGKLYRVHRGDVVELLAQNRTSQPLTLRPGAELLRRSGEAPR